MSDLKRDALEPRRYEYLSHEDSRLYDEMKAKPEDPTAKEVCRLLEEKSKSSRDAHRASTY